jgi:phosphatidylserine decarboxylase
MKDHSTTGILVRDRRTGAAFQERVYGEKAIQWLYRSKAGLCLEGVLLSKRRISQLMGAYHDSRMSVKKIASFIRNYEIQMEEFESGPFSSFNQFFVRRFKKGARPFATPPQLAAFAEARYFAWAKTTEETCLPVKKALLSPGSLLGGELPADARKRLEGGPLLLARLCPTDYHRFHYPDSGTTRFSKRVTGRLHSVNPVALQARPKAFLENERHVSLLECDHLGLLAFIEVGALGVGKILQTTEGAARFERGQEKGLFLFGGSTVIVLGEPGKWVPDADLLESTAQGLETFIRLGEGIASAATSTQR